MKTGVHRLSQIILALSCAAIPAASIAADAQAKSAAKPASSKQIERGRYLVMIAGCNDCHTPNFLVTGGKTPEKDRLTGGALGWRGPWGTTYPVNLRLYFQDMSEDMWVHEAKEIQRRPPMPYFSLNAMSEADVRAIYKYIRYLGMNDTTLFGRMQLQHRSLSRLMQFGDHLFVDHPTIDAQHKVIFDLGVKVYEDWRGGGSIDVLRPAVERLSNLMHSHFNFEERVLHEIGYEDLENHALEHRTMRDELSIMHERFHSFKEGEEIRGGSLLAPGWSIMQFILGFTVGHVATSDMSYNRALIANRHMISAL